MGRVTNHDGSVSTLVQLRLESNDIWSDQYKKWYTLNHKNPSAIVLDEWDQHAICNTVLTSSAHFNSSWLTVKASQSPASSPSKPNCVIHSSPSSWGGLLLVAFHPSSGLTKNTRTSQVLPLLSRRPWLLTPSESDRNNSHREVGHL